MESQYITAIDIGTTKIVAIAGKRTANNKVEILGVGHVSSKGVKRGVVLNIEETSNAIRSAVQMAENKSGVKFKDVFVGIAGQHIKSTRNRGYRYIDAKVGEITKGDVDALTGDMFKIPIEAGEEIIHVIPQNYIVDSESGVKNPIGMSGKRLEGNFHIVIGQVASARNITKCVERAGFNVVRMILEPLASSDAVLSDDEKEAGVALVDIGGGTTDIAVFYDDVIRHTAVVPFGGGVVTKDIKEGCQIVHRHAETLKVKYGSALPEKASEDKVVTIPGISGRESKEISFKTLAHIIQARMEEIIDAIAFEIENSSYYDKLGAGLVLTGGGALLKHLPQLVKYRTGLDVRLGLPASISITGLVPELNKPMYATSIGLLQKGLEHVESLQIKEKPKTMADEELDFEVKDVEEKLDDGFYVKRDSIINQLKKTITDMFDEKDPRMK